MAKSQMPPVSAAETEILRLIWKLDRATVQDVCNNLPDDRHITYATVQTLLRRLEKKGYVKHKTNGKAYVFYPAVDQSKVINRSVGDFVNKLFGGDPIPLIQHLAEHGQINAEDIEKLRKILDRK